MIVRILAGVASALLISFATFAQSKDTVRENVNYQFASRSEESEKTGRYYHYIGFQANQLLRQLIGSAGGGDNPFTLTYSFNTVSSGQGMSFGLGFSTRTVDDEDAAISLKRSTKTQNLAFRIGYEKRKSIARRWIAGIGVDVFRDGGSSETTTTFSNGPESVTTSKRNGIGFGPRLSLIFNVSERIYLGTETSLLFQSIKTTSETENPNFPSSTETEIKDKSLALGMPTSLFLIVRF